MAKMPHVVVDGRVFATEAADRGMGRYVDYLAALLVAAGYRVTMLLPGSGMIARRSRLGILEQALTLDDDPLSGTTSLNRFLERVGADLYLDATPFLPPDRYDVHICPVVAVLYDLIPMRFPEAYLASAIERPVNAYVNGVARVRKADQVIAISEHVKGHALHYLGVRRDQIVVIEPGLGKRYADFSLDPAPDPSPSAGSVVCIQGAHRSKNFPAAIPFLERVSVAAACDVDIIVPTPTQRRLIENVHQPGATRVRIIDSVTEERKFALQNRARTIAHLSLDEGYGIPLAEALYLFRPIVCLDNAINRELMGDCADPRSAGVLLLDDPRLETDSVLRAAAQFVREGLPADFAAPRRRIVDALRARRAQAEATLARALACANARFSDWQSRAGMSVVAPTEFGSCGVSDYCHALMRSEAPRYALLLGPAPKELQLSPQLRLLPVALLDDIRKHTSGVLFNLAISDSLTRAFDAIAEGSTPEDLLVIHDAGSYLPGLLLQTAATGDERLLFDRYLSGEPKDVRELARRWLSMPTDNPARSDALFLELDRKLRSSWLRSFRGRLVSHHAAFSQRGFSGGSDPLALLSADSEIRARTHYAPMPIDARASPGVARLARKVRWALGLARQDLLVCCAGSVVRGKHLDAVARVIARINAVRQSQRGPVMVTLLLAGRVLDDALFAAIRTEMSARGGASRLAVVVESDETRYDALLMASDAIVAFREQRRIQMSHSYVRALALGRPIITNEGAGFDDADVAVICRDDHLEQDLELQLIRIRDSISVRIALSAGSQSRYRERHTVDAFFGRVRDLHDVAAAV